MKESDNHSLRIDGKSRYSSLDGLRAVAIIGIVTMHYFFWIFKKYEFHVLANVFLTMFFVLSSFLISNLIMGVLEKQSGFRNYYIRRALRIYPAYYMFLFLFIAIVPNFLQNKEVLSTAYYVEHLGWFLTFTQNFMLLGQPLEILVENISLMHSWSLAVEEQFYLVWPLLLWLVPAKYWWHLFVGLILVSIIARFVFIEIWDLPGYIVHAQLLSRIDAFGIGAILALALRRGSGSFEYTFGASKKGYSIILAIMLTFVLITNLSHIISPTVFFETLVAIMCMRVIYWSVCTKNWVASVLELKGLVFIGKVSYSWYLLHFPIMWLIFHYLEITPKAGIGILILGFVVCVTLSFSVAFLLWQGIEKPFMKLKRKFNYF